MEIHVYKYIFTYTYKILQYYMFNNNYYIYNFLIIIKLVVY